MEITQLLAFAKKHNASDLHLSAGNSPKLRINGDITALRLGELGQEEVLGMIYSIMNEKQRAQYEEHWELDFSIPFGEHNRFRVNAFRTVNGAAATLRSIPTQIQSIEELKLPGVLKRFASLNKGLVLVTGPTGSGKSTTLAAIVNHINQRYAKHIITVEDPVEFIHKSQKSLVNQREIGSHTKSFSNALKSALREDPDVILVGEMRDLETIQLALTAAETGHLILGTLHTSSAAKTIDRIVDVFPAGEKEMARTMLSSSLEGVITQLLVQKANNEGRVAAIEILVANAAVRNLIRDNKIPQIYSLMQVGSKAGMRLMKESIYELLEAGVVSREKAHNLLHIENVLETEKSEF